MTELNQPPNPVDHTAVRWPQAPRVQGAFGHSTSGQGTTGPGMTDRDVDEALGLLSKLPDLEVAEHGTVYAELHDALLGALNAEALNGDSSSDDTRP
ncbi:hypothetical protein [Arthrobacter rhizosphaerae]|uniref:hypothetical protein n=1 Tax=Arthrobacter rhizosphaerae TaxID=2855490 RepID=UPI001FF62310|nr:hypothetical protein [Arthrobacter rhizosphaerae]